MERYERAVPECHKQLSRYLMLKVAQFRLNDGEADTAASQQEQICVWGRSDAQILAVGLAILWSTSYLAGKFQQLQDQREVYEAKSQAARAEPVSRRQRPYNSALGARSPRNFC